MNNNNVVYGKFLKAYDFENIASAATAKALTAAKVNPTGLRGADRVIITLESTEDIRWRMDGTAPTSSVGHLTAKGTSLIIEGHENISNFQFISTSATAGSLMVTYERF